MLIFKGSKEVRFSIIIFFRLLVILLPKSRNYLFQERVKIKFNNNLVLKKSRPKKRRKKRQFEL